MKLEDLNLNERLDIFVKILYIKGYIENENFNYYQKIYRKHIKLFNGGLEDDKKNIDDFEKNFKILIKNFKNNGFDNKFPIPINDKGKIINGAHRLACCIYFGIKPVFIVKKEHTVKWDYKWFENNLFGKDELMEIIRCFGNYFEYSIIILWPTLNKNIKDIDKIMSENFKIFSNMKLDLKDNLNELIYDIYSYDKGEIKLGIDFFEKGELLKKYGNKINVYVLLKNPKELKKEKYKLRTIFLKYTDFKKEETNLFNTFHSSDSINESRYLMKILFNYNSYKNLQKRVFKERTDFINRMNILKKYLKSKNIDEEKICVVGSGPLEIFNLDKTSDIDIIEEKPTNRGIIKLTPEIDLLDYEYGINIPNKEIINKYFFYFRGIKFIDLKTLYKIKSHGLRDKDISQIKKIDQFLNSKFKKSEKINNFKSELYYIKKKILIRLINFSIKITKKIGIYQEVSYLWRKYILKNLNNDKL